MVHLAITTYITFTGINKTMHEASRNPQTVDGSPAHSGNWMHHLNRPSNAAEVNTVTFHQGHNIYYLTIKPIQE